MSPEKQRIKIADVLGIRTNDGKRFYYWSGSERISVKCPDYLNSLDAMNEAERLCRYLDDYEYSSRLADFYMGDQRLAVFATAAQRAEAFLKTLGLWEVEA